MQNVKKTESPWAKKAKTLTVQGEFLKLFKLSFLPLRYLEDQPSMLQMLGVTTLTLVLANVRYRKVASSRPVYYSILNSQYISIKFPLHKQSENPKMCY